MESSSSSDDVPLLARVGRLAAADDSGDDIIVDLDSSDAEHGDTDEDDEATVGSCRRCRPPPPATRHCLPPTPSTCGCTTTIMDAA